MITYIYKELMAEAFTPMGKNNIKHPDIIKAFGIEKTGHYAEIYKEIWGYSVHLFGKGFMNGYYPTIVVIIEQKDVKGLRTKIKTVFSSNGIYSVLCDDSEQLVCDCPDEKLWEIEGKIVCECGKHHEKKAN